MPVHVNPRRRVIPRPTLCCREAADSSQLTFDRPFNRRSADYRSARSPATRPSAVRRPRACSLLL